MRKYILASGSPRRHQLLKEVIDEFDIVIPNSEEIIKEELLISEVTMDIALQKAREVVKNYREAFVIGADTVVYCNGEVLLKPEDFNDAFRILTLLSKNKHSVITGVAFVEGETEYTFYDETIIEFQNMSSEWITNYINEMQPYDKSGSYGIQEIDKKYIKTIEGSIKNVVGLPVEKLKEELSKFKQM